MDAWLDAVCADVCVCVFVCVSVCCFRSCWAAGLPGGVSPLRLCTVTPTGGGSYCLLFAVAYAIALCCQSWLQQQSCSESTVTYFSTAWLSTHLGTAGNMNSSSKDIMIFFFLNAELWVKSKSYMLFWAIPPLRCIWDIFVIMCCWNSERTTSSNIDSLSKGN